MTKLWTGRELVNHTGMPRELFAHLTTTLYRSAKSASGKFHKDRRCGHIRTRRYALTSVVVDAAGVPESRGCLCLPYGVPEHWEPVLRAAAPIAHLLDNARRLARAERDDLTPGLDHVALVLSEQPRLAAHATEFLDQLEASAAPTTTLKLARAWLSNAAAEAVAAHAIAASVLAGDPDREQRQAAVDLIRAIDAGFNGEKHAALAENGWRMDSTIKDRCNEDLREALMASPDEAAARAAALAVIDEDEPESLDQIPDVAVDSSLLASIDGSTTLRDLMLSTWRNAAREQLGQLVDLRLQEYREARTRTLPALLVADTDLDQSARARLSRYPAHLIEAGVDDEDVNIYLVPEIIGLAAGQHIRGIYVPAAPIPEDFQAIATAALDDTAGSASGDLDALWSSTYLTTLIAMLSHLDPDQAVTAALGVAHAA